MRTNAHISQKAEGAQMRTNAHGALFVRPWLKSGFFLDPGRRHPDRALFSYPVPSGNFEGETGTDLLDKFVETFGHFGFAQRGQANNPAVIVEYQGDTFLPVIRVPYSIFIAQVANYSTGISQI